MNVRFTESAKRELDEAFQWYEEQNAGLGSRFVLNINASITRLVRFPKLATSVGPEVFRVLVNRFPYSIYYSACNEHVLVLSIGHQHRLPRSWK